MRLIDSISSFVNYGMTGTDRAVKKIAGNLSAIKKVLQVTDKIFARVDLYSIGEVQKRAVTETMKGSVDLIGFYGSYKDIMFWMNLFSKDSLDQNKLEESIKDSLCASHHLSVDAKGQQELAQIVFDEVMKKEVYHNKAEVIDVIQESLQMYGYETEAAKILAGRVTIQQKARSVNQLAYMACFTLLDLGGSAIALEKWHILELSHLAISIGNQFPVFKFVVNLGVGPIFGVTASAGLFLLTGEAFYRVVVQGSKLMQAQSLTQSERDLAYGELRKALLDFLSGGTDLVSAAAPLFFTLNPALVVSLAIVAKGTGLICILVL